MEQVNLLEEIELSLQLQPANARRRFIAFFIDLAGAYLLFLLITALVEMLYFLLSKHSAEFAEFVLDPRNHDKLAVIALFLFAPCYGLYYLLFETLTRGKTPGKYIAGTQAVNKNGSRLSFKKVLARSCVRMVPFEFTSLLFGYSTWHDNWTRTQVIRKPK